MTWRTAGTNPNANTNPNPNPTVVSHLYGSIRTSKGQRPATCIPPLRRRNHM